MKCRHKNNENIIFFGQELDSFRYVPVERHENVNVTILRCRVCGAVEIEWERTPETVDYISEDGGSIE